MSSVNCFRPRSGPGRRREPAALIVTLLAAVIAPAAYHPDAANAANEDAPLASTPVVTYNTQGANSGDSKWAGTLGPIMEAGTQIALLPAVRPGQPFTRCRDRRLFSRRVGPGF
jgi:hypothetical protein